MTKKKTAALAGLAAFALVAMAGCGDDDDDSGSSDTHRGDDTDRDRAPAARRRRGPGEPGGLGRLRRERLDRPGRRLGDRLRGGDRLQGQRQDRQHLRRDGAADEDGRVRRRVGLGRRHAAAHRRRRRRAGEHRPHPELRRRVPGAEEQAVELRERRALRRAPRPGGQPADVEHRRGDPGARLVGCGVGRGLALQGLGHGLRQPHLHRRRRAVPDEDAARPGHHQPLRPRPGPVRRRRRPAEDPERHHRRVLERLHQADRGLHAGLQRARHDLAGDRQPCPGRRTCRSR